MKKDSSYVWLSVSLTLIFIVGFGLLGWFINDITTTSVQSTKLSLNANSFEVNYLPLSKSIALGNYTYIEEGINEKTFPIPIELFGRQEVVEWKIFSGYVFPEDIERDLRFEGYRHSTLTELLSFKAVMPDSLSNLAVISMGSITTLEEYKYPYLYKNSLLRGRVLFPGERGYDGGALRALHVLTIKIKN